jgi:hypothetical protein
MWNTSLIDGPIDIYEELGLDEEGVMQYGVKIPGYHLNMAKDYVPEEALTYEVTPSTPVRVFAGGNTAFLCFENEEQAKEVLIDYWTE